MSSAHSIPNSCDTVVVGAGPSGVMAALHAAARGPVVLVESSSLPRDKSCGGMLNEHAQQFLSAYGAIPESMLLNPRWVHFRYNDWDRKITKLTDLRFANVNRSSFDQWLMSLLPDNVRVVTESTFLGFQEREAGVTVSVSAGGTNPHLIECENLIGCDGPRSSVRRALTVDRVANYVTLQDFCTLEAEIAPFFDCIYMRNIGDCFAYAYVVPKGDTAIVGSVFHPKTTHPHVKHDQALAVLRESLPLGDTTKREAWSARSVRHRSDVLCGSGRVLLAGEAGGFMSPTSGEGISYALNSGRHAGVAIANSAPSRALAAHEVSTRHITSNIRRKLVWLPFMESRAGKHLAGYVPQSLVSRVTQGL